MIVTQLYWIIASLGFLDLDFFDLNIEMDLEGAESSGLLNAVGVFIEFGEVPITLVLSILSLNFWLMMMLTFYAPIKAGGIISALLLLPVFGLSLVITKYQVLLIKMSFFEKKSRNTITEKVLEKRCKLLCNLVSGKLGQAEVNENGGSIVINVRTRFEDDAFKKGDLAFIYEKDEEKNVYYITNYSK